MREIKFRGLFEDVAGNKIWVYGGFVKNDDGSFAISKGARKHGYPTIDLEVDPETVGQYIGLTDKYGIEGYHKDLWEFLNTLYIVEWDDKKAGFYLKNIHPRATEDDDIEMEHFSEGRIVGNEFEHPHLLKEGIETSG